MRSIITGINCLYGEFGYATAAEICDDPFDFFATSWSSPYFAGIAARILTLKPDLKPFEIKTILYWMFKASQSSA